MAANAPRLANESDLIEILCQKQEEWIRATDDFRELARERFLDALQASFATYEDPPRA
jgi:hypothetical protein